MAGGLGGVRPLIHAQGAIPKFTFNDFRFEILSTDGAARLFLQKRALEHYWDMARDYDTNIVRDG